jgi:hypothetical protein
MKRPVYYCETDSSDGITTGYGLDGPGLDMYVDLAL